MPKPRRPRTHRTQFSMPADLHAKLKDAILKRAALASWGRGRKRPAATLSGWIQEQAAKFIRAQS